jgi:hypothetical protein
LTPLGALAEAQSNTIRNNNIYGNRGVGSTSGPGADPADDAGTGCDFNQGTTAYGISL